MFAGLVLVYGHLASEDQAAPLLGPAVIAGLLGVLLMLLMVRKAEATPARGADAAAGTR